MITVGDLATAFDVTATTIRRWAFEFADYLSSGANPADKGDMRLFTVEDAERLALVAELRDRAQNYDKIHAALAAGDRGHWPPGNGESEPEPEPERDAGQQYGLTLQLAAQAARLEGEIAAVRDERDHLRQQVSDLTQRLIDAEKRAAAGPAGEDVAPAGKGEDVEGLQAELAALRAELQRERAKGWLDKLRGR